MPLRRLLFLLLLLPSLVLAAADSGLERRPDGVTLPVDDGWLFVQVRAPDIFRVAYARDRRFFDRKSFIVETSSPAPSSWLLETDAGHATLKTAQAQARIDLRDGAVTFLDSSGQVILAERSGGRSLTPTTLEGEKTFHLRQQWEANADESLAGLGQLQLGVVDLKGYDLDLWQRNTNVVVPFFVSSRGYGILWDNPSFTRFGDLRPFAPIPAGSLRTADGQPGGLTRETFSTDSTAPSAQTTTSDLTADHAWVEHKIGPTWRWIGALVPPATGDYQFRTYSNGTIKVWLDGRPVIDHWRQHWLTEYDQVKLHLEAGRSYAFQVEAGGEEFSTMHLLWKTPAPAADATTSLWSEIGDGVDYYFVYGPSLDHVIAGYRHLTGAATMLPQWAFGLWQSRQRYETAQQSIDVVKEFRRRGIPFDNIVQDWRYWPLDAWGSHHFDAARFPDPDAWIKELHELHAHLMISVWGKFYPGTANFDAMQRAGYLYQPSLKLGLKDWLDFNYTFYDAFNPGARKLFWSQVDTALFRRGIDAWWMDATEPDVVQPSPPTLASTKELIGDTALGPAAKVLNAYPLFNSRAVYEGQRSSAPDQRVFILTRSGFAGIQRYATVTWSGDTTSTWTGLAKQISAGLGYSISGTPYWTMDIGGYTMDARFGDPHQTPEAQDEWRELNARWFEFGTFCPLTRLHGELQPREPWTFGADDGPAYRAIVKFDELRYRLLPYIYSLDGAVNRHGGTMMRPLLMDFPADATARALTDEYLFGPALLVAPVTHYHARSRAVYLPATRGGWFNFWNGAAVAGGQSIGAAAPCDEIPVFVRAGAILPFGPRLQYVGEKPADPITLYVYAGADGSFTLYEDDGTTYGYERGEFTEIPLHWNNDARTLTIGARAGKYPGMIDERTFNIVVVSPRSPVAAGAASPAQKIIRYRGAAAEVRFE
ncbi:MAG TPA: TIM-barrel domain-containing protein [Opitutus sp.]|nr:TIM-barrel domain-containing protein [Opitutus sp.]